MPTSEPTVHEVFRGAANRLHTLGWCQNAYSTDDRECAIKSLLSQLGTCEDDDPILELRYLTVLDRVLLAHTSDYQFCRKAADEETDDRISEAVVIEFAVFEWNDRPGRKPEEVIRMLELAGDMAEQEWWAYHSYLLAANEPVDTGVSIRTDEVPMALVMV